MATTTFNSKASGNLRDVQGMVTRCDTMAFDDRKVYLLHIENGAQRERFWLEHDQSNPHFLPPMNGEWISGTVSKLMSIDDCRNVDGESFKPVLNLKNSTRNSEDAAFAWFRQQEADRRRNEIKKNNSSDPEPQ